MITQKLVRVNPKLNLQPAAWLLAAAFSAMLCAPQPLLGIGVALPDQDAFATARGNAFVATADDPAAVYYNPAGISQLVGIDLSVGAYGIAYWSTYKGAAGSIDSQTQLEALPQIFATYSLPQYRLTLGLGAYSPYGLRMEWPMNAPFLAAGETGEVDFYTLNPVMAWQIYPSLSIAAGPTLNYSQVDLKEYPGFVNHFRGRDMDVGYNVGLLWRPAEQHSFGLTYRSATDMNYSGHATVPLDPPQHQRHSQFPLPPNHRFRLLLPPDRKLELRGRRRLDRLVHSPNRDRQPAQREPAFQLGSKLDAGFRRHPLSRRRLAHQRRLHVQHELRPLHHF